MGSQPPTELFQLRGQELNPWPSFRVTKSSKPQMLTQVVNLPERKGRQEGLQAHRQGV